MQIQSLGYVGIRSKSLEDWATYGSRFLGMQLTDRSRQTLAFRMDDRKQRIVVQEGEGEGPAFYGWEVSDAAALDALAAHLERSQRAEQPGAVHQRARDGRDQARDTLRAWASFFGCR